MQMYRFSYNVYMFTPSFFKIPDAIYDCASLYSKNYKISGEYKLPKDDFLGTPELNVCLIPVLFIACVLCAFSEGGPSFSLSAFVYIRVKHAGLLRYGNKRRWLDSDSKA